MEQPNPTGRQKGGRIKVILVAAVIVLLCVIIALLLFRQPQPVASEQESESNTPQMSEQQTPQAPKLTYANDGVVALGDVDDLQAAVDKAMQNASEGKIALDYKNVAISADGKVFTCHLGNSAENKFDMYVDIYSDIKMTDQLFLSGMIRPGEAFGSIELNRALEPGVHTVYCAFTQVEEDHASLRGQLVVALEMRVEG